jgi:hypothetical protein
MQRRALSIIIITEVLLLMNKLQIVIITSFLGKLIT